MGKMGKNELGLDYSNLSGGALVKELTERAISFGKLEMTADADFLKVLSERLEILKEEILERLKELEEFHNTSC